MVGRNRVLAAALAVAAVPALVIAQGQTEATTDFPIDTQAAAAASASSPGAEGPSDFPPRAGTTDRDGASGAKVLPAPLPPPERVYVPNEMSNSVSVIDPTTFTVIATIKVGSHPQHITPDWDLSRLYVNDASLTELDPLTGTIVRSIPVAMPYNLYFTPDGTRAIVVAEDLDRLDFYDRASWTFLRSVRIPWKGVDHMDFSLDGGYLLATTEYTGRILRIDLAAYAITGVVEVGGLPVDVRLSLDGSVFFVTNQGRHGVSVIDPVAMKEIGFIGTGRGAHGLQLSRDGRRLYVSNRLAGTISVIDAELGRVIANWPVGGSPDMLQLSPAGDQLWMGNRSANSVTVVDTSSGTVLARIVVGRAPHGLTYFPQRGRFSIGHNGVYR